MIRYEDQKGRILMVDKDPCRRQWSVYLCYSDGRVRRTSLPALRDLPTLPVAVAELKQFAKRTGCKKRSGG